MGKATKRRLVLAIAVCLGAWAFMPQEGQSAISANYAGTVLAITCDAAAGVENVTVSQGGGADDFQITGTGLGAPITFSTGKATLTAIDVTCGAANNHVDLSAVTAALGFSALTQTNDIRLSKKTCGRILAPVVAQVYGTKRFPGFDRCEIRTLVS